jgi:hypothetical protein
VAAQIPDGGRAEGELWRTDTSLAFQTCWTASGEQVWLAGDAGVISEGNEAACTVPALAAQE